MTLPEPCVYERRMERNVTTDTSPDHAISTDVLADELLDALDRNVQIQPITERYPGFDNAAAYRVNAEIFRRRVARGERPIGRKIGFTNRTIWPEYGVYEPMWAHVYDTTVQFFAGNEGTQPIGHLAEPRIEPEILLHFSKSPAGARTEEDVLGCIDWIAHSIEVVQSHFPAWKFAAPDTAAAFGLHGALMVGPKRSVSELDDLIGKLRAFTIALSREGEVRARGGGANVLDSPLLALAHLLRLLDGLPQFEPIQAGEIVSTGTLTAALPIAPGETWSTEFSGLELDGLRVRFT
jgi:2-oxo-3-hexenedioate decarboxylase